MNKKLANNEKSTRKKTILRNESCTKQRYLSDHMIGRVSERESEKEQGATNSDSIRTLPAMCKVHSDLQTTLLLKAKPVAGKVTKYRMRYLMWPSDVQEGSCDYTTSNQGDATPLHY